MKKILVCAATISIVALSIHFVKNTNKKAEFFPAPIEHVFEAQDGLHVLYKDDDRIEDILIELEDEQDVYYFDIDDKQHSVLLIRHCTIGDCDMVDVSIDNGRILCVPSHVVRANQTLN